MKLELIRKYNKDSYCIGNLYVDGVFVCNTLEDHSRGIDNRMSEAVIAKYKVPEETAIPTGTYKVTLAIQSPSFSKRKYYWDFCRGYLPRLIGVKGYTGILIHRGATAENTEGCLIVGQNKVKGKVINSQECFERLYNGYLLPAAKKHEEITITIKEKF